MLEQASAILAGFVDSEMCCTVSGKNQLENERSLGAVTSDFATAYSRAQTYWLLKIYQAFFFSNDITAFGFISTVRKSHRNEDNGLLKRIVDGLKNGSSGCCLSLRFRQLLVVVRKSTQRDRNAVKSY